MENGSQKNKIEKSREIENSEAKIVRIPDDAIFLGGKTNKELTIETTDKNSAKFAVFNVNGNEAEYAYVGKAVNENWFEGVAQITNSVNDNLNNFNYVKNIETGKVKKENDKWVVSTMAKIKFIDENAKNLTTENHNEFFKDDAEKKEKIADIEKRENAELSLIKESDPIPASEKKIYLSEREGTSWEGNGLLFKEKTEGNGYYVIFGINGTKAKYRFDGRFDRAWANYDAVLKDVFDDNKTVRKHITSLINVKDGEVELQPDGKKWKITKEASIIFDPQNVIESINAKYDAELERLKNTKEETQPTIKSSNTLSQPENKEQKNEEWTEEDQKTLDNLNGVIETAIIRAKQIADELERRKNLKG